MGTQGGFAGLTGITVPIAVIVAAIATVSLALVDLWKTSEKFQDAVGLAVDMLKDSIVGAFKKVSEAITPLWDSIKELGKAFYDFYEFSGLKWIIEQLESFGAVLIGSAGSVVIKQIASAIAGLCKALKGLVDTLKGVLQILTGFITGDFSKIKEGFSSIGEGLAGIFNRISEALFGWIKDVWADICDKFQEPFERSWSSITEWWNENIVPFFMKLQIGFQGYGIA